MFTSGATAISIVFHYDDFLFAFFVHFDGFLSCRRQCDNA